MSIADGIECRAPGSKVHGLNLWFSQCAPGPQGGRDCLRKMLNINSYAAFSPRWYRQKQWGRHVGPHQGANPRHTMAPEGNTGGFLLTTHRKGILLDLDCEHTRLASILCDKVEICIKHFYFVQSDHDWRNSTVGSCLSCKLTNSSFSQNMCFILKKTDKLWLFRLEYRADIFSKMNKVSLSLQEKQRTVFTAKDSIYVKRSLTSISNF